MTFRRLHLALLASLFVVIGSASAAYAGVIEIFNTGVDDSGNPLPNGTTPDPHYDLTMAQGGPTNLLIRTLSGGYPIPPYLGDNGHSTWIGPNYNDTFTAPPGEYRFATVFNLGDYNLETAMISGRWASDNNAEMFLNGVSTGNVIPWESGGSFSFEQWTSFSLTDGFLPGVNTLEFAVYNGGTSGNPVALRVKFLETFATVPAPASLALFALGLIGAHWYRRRNGH